jgi:hypothetical protein
MNRDEACMSKLSGVPANAHPLNVDGMIFRCFRLGAARYEWRSDEGGYAVGRTWQHGLFYVARDRYPMPHRFPTLESALRFAAYRLNAELALHNAAAANSNTRDRFA